MSDLFEMQLIGHLGADPESRYVESTGQLVCNFRVAVNRRWKNADGETQEATAWVRVAAWGKLGEVCDRYLKKGRQVWVRGRPEAHPWTDKDGNVRAELRVTAQEVQFLDGGRKGEATDDEDEIPF